MPTILIVFVDVESIYFILMEIVKMIGMNEECKTICVSICDMVLSSSMATNLKARILSLILNCMPSFKECRAALLHKVINFAHESKSLEFYYKYLISQDNKEWETVIEEYRQVLVVLRKTLLDMQRSHEAHHCLVKLLSTYKPEEPEYKEFAVACAVEELQSTIHDETGRVNEYPLLQGLEKCDKELFDLLCIVNSGDLQRLPGFLTSHQSLLSQHQLDQTTLMQRARLLSLARLCGSRSMMTYMEIAKELDVPKEEAEQYIVNAVQMGLVEGRMDQIKEEFAVTRTQCIVVDGEWENMRCKIQQWKKNVQFVLDSCDAFMKTRD